MRSKMPNFNVRLPLETAQLLMTESLSTGRTISETLRVVLNRHALKEYDNEPLMEKLSQVHDSLQELGKDLETVTRMLLVVLRACSEDEARAWTLKNLRVGR